MEAAIPKMETQLRTWRSEIDRLARAVHGVGSDGEFDALLFIDELKALHAIACFKLDEYKAAEGEERRRLDSGLKGAWVDLGAALENLGS